jgi:hypothetical protein
MTNIRQATFNPIIDNSLPPSERAFKALALAANGSYADLERSAKQLSSYFENLMPGDYDLLLHRIQNDQNMIRVLTTIAEVLQDVQAEATKNFVRALENRPYIQNIDPSIQS